MDSSTDIDLATNDLGPLAWVLDELRKSLDSASAALRRFVRDTGLARGTDMASVDAGQLRIARQQLHQAVGALEMVGLGAPAYMLRSMEAAVQKFVEHPELCTDAAAAKVERAGFALTEYLEGVLLGKATSSVALFPQYRDVQEISSAERIHPADLWQFDWRWTEPFSPESTEALVYDPAVRSRMDQGVLKIVKNGDPDSARALIKVSLGLAATQGARQPKVFWKICAGFFEALSLSLLPLDNYVKRAASRVLMQYASLAKGELGVSDRLAQDLVFFCAQAVPPEGVDAPALRAVRDAWTLARFKPVDYTTPQFGRFDPVLLAQSRKRIAAAKETWSALSGGDANKLKGLTDQFHLVSDSLVKLHPPSGALAQALNSVTESVSKSGRAPGAELAMEVATAVLYLEAAFQDLDPSDPQLAVRTGLLADRLDRARQGGQAEPLEAWMEELYRRVSDRQTMGSVVGELRGTLGELEKLLDQYFRDLQNKAPLRDAPSHLAQMRGVLSVLGLDQAAQAVSRMRDVVEEIIVTEIDETQARASGTFDKLGNNLGALGFLIDMLNYQPSLAKKLFVYDDSSGELRPLMGRTGHQVLPDQEDHPAAAPAPKPAAYEPAHMATQVMQAYQPPAATPAPQAADMLQVPDFAPAPHVSSQEDLDRTAREAVLAMTSADPEAAAAAFSRLDEAVSGFAPFEMAAEFAPAASPRAATPIAPMPPVSSEPDFEEEDLLDIFLEEAREVVGNGLIALDALAANPRDPTELTTLRRAFHTLKGSSRMVGLNEFGEAGWSMEQVLNTWLADQKPATDELQILSRDAMKAFGHWVEDIAAHDDSAWKASIFRVPADALRVENKLIEIVLPAGKKAAPAAVPAAPGAEASAFGDLDFSFGDEAPAEPIAEAPVAEAAEAEAAPSLDMADFDLNAFGSDPTIRISAKPATEPEPAAIAGLDDLSFDMPGEPATATAPESAAPEADADEFGFGATQVMDGAPDVKPDAATEPEELELGDLEGDFDFEPSPTVLLRPGGNPMGTTRGAQTDEEVEPTPLKPEPAAAIEGIDFSSLAEVSGHGDLESIETPPLLEDEEPIDFAFGDAASHEVIELGAEPDGDSPVDAAAEEVIAAEVPPVNDAPIAFADLAQFDSAGDMADEEPDAKSPQAHGSHDAHAGREAHQDLHDESDDERDEQIKVIGPLRIGIPLYNVYLNEADEWSRRLATEVAEWALQIDQPIGDSTVGLAHALAGSSATVGFHALSDIARGLESALQRAQRLAWATPQHSKAFTDAAEEIRRLLHQFAAGFLKEPTPGVVEAMVALEALEIPTRAEAADEADEADEDEAPKVESDFDPLDFASSVPAPAPVAEAAAEEPAEKSVVQAKAEAEDEPDAVIAAESVADAEPEIDLPQAEPQPVAAPRLVELIPAVALVAPAAAFVAPVAAADRHTITASDESEEFDIADALDPDLFPIFEEEAAELMPQLGGALRQWSARPENRSARDESLRALHTLKGSARLAGALRLGELAHRMESEIEYLGAQPVAADIEPLLQRFDNMQANFDALRVTGGQPAPEVAQAQAAELLIDSAAASAEESASGTASVDPLTQTQTVDVSKVTQRALAKPAQSNIAPQRAAANQAVRVRSQLLDRLVNQAGEVMITRSRLEAELRQLRSSLTDLTGNLDRLRSQLRDIELQAETQMQSRLAQSKDTGAGFDPLEFDRFTRVQELTRMMAESVNDVATVQRNLQRTVESTEDDLIAQARQTRELQRDLLRTRMVEFEGISDRLYRVVRLASKETGKQVKLDITGGSIEMDRGVLDRMTPAFEHLLRNCVAHGIEDPETRTKAGKDAAGTILIGLNHEGNDVSVEFRDDGAGLHVKRIREKALQQGLITPDQELSDQEAANLIFMPGFSTAATVTELSGRGIGMDVVRAEVNALGGRIETATQEGQGTSFRLVLPLTTAVTQVVMIRSGKQSVGVPANVIEVVRRATAKEIEQAYNSGTFEIGGEQIPFYWSGALLQSSRRSVEPQARTMPVVVFRSAAQRIAMHVDEVLGNQEVVVKNLGPQLARLPGLAGMTVLASGAVVLIYNPVALSTVYGDLARKMSADSAQPDVLGENDHTHDLMPVAPQIPLVLVVDDSITVRRVTQRLLQREGYRVVLAADGLQALERLAEERPTVVLSDIEMPRMDGFDLARNIRGDARLKDLPIVMITSRIAEKHREHARELGVDHYLGKPYSEEELLSLVKHYSTAATMA